MDARGVVVAIMTTGGIKWATVIQMPTGGIDAVDMPGERFAEGCLSVKTIKSQSMIVFLSAIRIDHHATEEYTVCIVMGIEDFNELLYRVIGIPVIAVETCYDVARADGEGVRSDRCAVPQDVGRDNGLGREFVVDGDRLRVCLSCRDGDDARRRDRTCGCRQQKQSAPTDVFACSLSLHGLPFPLLLPMTRRDAP